MKGIGEMNERNSLGTVMEAEGCVVLIRVNGCLGHFVGMTND